MYDGHTPVLPPEEMLALGFIINGWSGWYHTGEIAAGVKAYLEIDGETGNYIMTLVDTVFAKPLRYNRFATPTQNQIWQALEDIIADLNAQGLTLEINHFKYGYYRITE